MKKITFTANSVDSDTGEESHGWINPDYSMFTMYDNAEDVPAYEIEPGESDEEVNRFIESHIGSIDHSERGTFYGSEAQMDMDTGKYWSYAAHIE